MSTHADNPEGMGKQEQIQALEADLWRVLDRYKDEFDLTLAEAVGCLEVVKMGLWNQQRTEAAK